MEGEGLGSGVADEAHGEGEFGGMEGAEAAGEMFGDAGDRVDLGEIKNLGENFVGTDGFTGDNVHRADEAGNGSSEANGGRRVFELAAFDDDGDVAPGDEVIVFHRDLEGAAGDAAADDGAAAGEDVDAAEGENGFLEIAGLGGGGLEAEVGDAGGVEDDGIGPAEGRGAKQARGDGEQE